MRDIKIEVINTTEQIRDLVDWLVFRHAPPVPYSPTIYIDLAGVDLCRKISSIENAPCPRLGRRSQAWAGSGKRRQVGVNIADRSTNFGLESRSSLLNSAIKLENNYLGSKYSRYILEVQYGQSRAFRILLIILRFISSRILK